jgi:RimJ/RimL family protein N-acetyltransferase
MLGPGRIQTQRLNLEPLSVEDADAMVEVLADPSLYAFTGGEPPTLPELKARYELQVSGRSPDATEEWLNWIVRLASDGEAIGFVQATVVETGADVAWVIAPRWQGKGYASEAAVALVRWLETNGIETITAFIHPDHMASAAVARRAGLTPTEEVVDGEIAWRRRSPCGFVLADVDAAADEIAGLNSAGAD